MTPGRRVSLPLRARMMQLLGYWAAVMATNGCHDRKAPGGASDTVAAVSPRYKYNESVKADIGRYEVMRTADLVPMSLTRVRTVSLGSRPDETPASVDRTKVTPGRIIVIDEAARMVRVYTRAGRSLFVIPIGSAAGHDLRSPVALTSAGGTLRVLDLDPNRGVVVFDTAGREVAATQLKVAASTVDFAQADSSYIVATIADDKEIAAGSGVVVWAVDRNGGSIPLGCRPDPLYQHSIDKGGLFQMFRFFGVSVEGGRIFCRQPISPVVHILDSRTLLTTLLRRAPPFYQRGDDRPQSTNSVTVNRFRSTWTEHSRFFANPAGFVSVYNSFDVKAGKDTWLLFDCDSASGVTRCGARASPGPPLDLLAPDTLVILEPLKRPGDLQRVGFYRLRM